MTNEPVAIKSVLRMKLTKKLLDNLVSEINILKGIRHDHIVALVDCQVSKIFVIKYICKNKVHFIIYYTYYIDM
jgi:serine/threonine-protein kinase ULK/ATG1